MKMLSFEDELPKNSIPYVENWSDDYVFHAYDESQGFGFQVHLTRWHLDASIWREFIVVFLPDGTSLVRQGAGRRDSANGPSGALLEFSCEAVGSQWRIHYRGPARKVTNAQLANGPLAECTEILLELDATFHSDVQAWIHNTLSDEPSFTSHYEQPGRVTCVMNYGGNAVSFNGFAFRDHNRGPRDLESLCSYAWVHGELSGGRIFSMFTLCQGVDPAHISSRYIQSAIWDNGKIHSATCPNPPTLLSSKNLPQSYELTLDGQWGRMHVQSQVLRSVPFSISINYDYFLGIAPGPAKFVTFIEPTKFLCNGETGFGVVERLVPLNVSESTSGV